MISEVPAPPCARRIWVTPGQAPSSWALAYRRASAESLPALLPNSLGPGDEAWLLSALAAGLVMRPPEQEGTSTLPALRIPEGKKVAQRDQLYELARRAGAQPFRSHDGRPFCDLPMPGGGRRTVPLSRGGRFAAWLRQTFTQRAGRLPSSQAVTECKAAIEAFALGDSATIHRVELRVGGGEQMLVVDLGREDWRCAVVTPEGWLVTVPPDGVRFERGARFGGLPEPATSAPVVAEVLRPLLAPVLETSDDLNLVVAFLFGTLMPGPGRAHLFLAGGHGGAKTSTAGMLRGFVDPVRATRNAAGETTGAVNSVRSIAALAKANYVLALDNLSHVTPEISDVLCRLCTGGSIDERQLYTDAELHSLDLTRPAILTSIVDVVGRADLLDRIIAVQTRPPSPRLTDVELRRRVREAAPLVLGGLLDAAVVALRERRALDHPGDDLRLLDFTQWVRAGAPVLGLEPAKFVRAYRGNRALAVAAATEESRMVMELSALASRQGGWTGSLSQLKDVLDQQVPRCERPQDWPGTLKKLSGELRRFTAALRSVYGVEVLHNATSHKARTWTLRMAPNRGGGSESDGGDAQLDAPLDVPSRKASETGGCEPGHAVGAQGADRIAGDLHAHGVLTRCGSVRQRARWEEDGREEPPHPPFVPVAKAQGGGSQ